MAAALDRKPPVIPAVGPNDDLPPEYWNTLLQAADADAPSRSCASAKFQDIC
jgi:hypothetical protein